MTWPRGWAIAEVLWSVPQRKEWNDFVRRVEDHFVRAENAGVNYARSMYNAIVTPSMLDGELRVELGSELENTDIYYTFDNTDPDNYTAKYSSALAIPRNATWLRVATYRNGKPAGKTITLTIEELTRRVPRSRRAVVGNIDLPEN
jgi:hexosaminidase